MFKHILVTAVNKDNTETIAESYFQVNLFGKQLKLFKRRTKLTTKQKAHKPTDDYISIRIPKYGDKPIVQMRGERAVNAAEGIESVKFVWVTKDTRGANMDIPFMDVKLLHGADDGEFVRLLKGVGSEIEAETLRQTINLSEHTKEMYRLLNARDLMVAVTPKSKDDTAKGYRIVDVSEANFLVTFHCVEIYTRMADGSMKCITNRINSLDGVTLYIKEEDYSYCNDLPIRPEVSD